MRTRIKQAPYSFICDYVESVYPKIGRKTFEVLSLMPCSLIIPDIPFGSKRIRSNIHAIFLGSSGSGKSSIAKLFSNFVINPLEFESVTSAAIEGAISQNPVFTLIVGDFARMSRDPVLMKLLEGILGEEKRIQRATARKDIDIDVNGICLLCGVSNDLSKYIISGMLWRLNPLLVGHSSEEHSMIGEHIKNSIGKIKNGDEEQVIKDYYMELAKIQSGDDRVIGYNISEEYKNGIYVAWDKMTKPYVKELGLNFFRELWDGFRFMVSHSFLNYFNRNVVDGIITIEEEDYFTALKLMKQSIKFKFRLIRSESFAKGLKDVKDFKKIMQSEKVPEQVKDMIRGLVEIKGEKVTLR